MEGIGQKKETDYIFDKTIKCDVCGKEFKTKQVRTGKARFIGTDDILKPLYEGIDTCKYDIIMCPHCGYAASLRLFGHHTEKLLHIRRPPCNMEKALGTLQRSRKQKLTAMREL